MAVSSYVNENGVTVFRVYVNVRSKINLSIRAQRKASGIKTEKEANREESRLIRECERELFERETKGACWSAVVAEWEKHLSDSSNANELTKGDYVTAIKNNTSEWHNMNASSITRLDVKNLLNRLKLDGGSHSFIKRVKNLINRIFIFGIEAGLIKGMNQSPTFGIKVDRAVEKKPEILTTAEIRKLLSEAIKYKHPWYPVWAMALMTGMRSGELFALNWSDVSWDTKTISVNKSYNGRLKTIKCTKSGEYRLIPIANDLMDLLNDLKKKTGHTSFVLPRHWLWTRGYQAAELRKFCLGVDLPSIRFHALRACFATQLVQNGVPAIVVQKICGWKDLKTMQRYIRMAGVEVGGATEGLNVLPKDSEAQNYHAEIRDNYPALENKVVIEGETEDLAT